MTHLNLKTLTATLAAFLLMSGLFANQALAAARIVVAKSGGEYTTITAALNAITPTATNPYVIEVWPGVYTETSTVNLKSYVHLKGSGRDVTTIQTSQGTSSDVLSIGNKINIIISGFTITGGMTGIRLAPYSSGYPDEQQSVTIRENTISNNTYGIAGLIGRSSIVTNSTLITHNNIVNNTSHGLQFERYPVTLITNYISGNDSGEFGGSAGIHIDNDAGTQPHDHVLMGNIITGNNGVGIYIYANTNPVISNNVITGNSRAGINYYSSNSAGSVANNKIVNNGGTNYTDIIVGGSGSITPNISFNIFDDITGTRGVGNYNVKFNGDASPVP